MLTKAQSKLLRSLKHKKYRQKYGLFTAEGTKTVMEILNTPSATPELILGLPTFIEKNKEILETWSSKLVEVNERELASHSFLQQPNQVICMLSQFPELTWDELNREPVLLYLEHLQDPGNLGTIIRIADWFDHAGIICSPDTVDPHNPKVVQACMGSFLRVGIKTASLDEITSEMAQHTLLATSMEGESLYLTEIPERVIVMIGNESRGLSNNAFSRVNRRIAIPGNKKQTTDSLNAAVAAGIVCSVIDHRQPK